MAPARVKSAAGALDARGGAALAVERDQARLLVEQALLQAGVDALVTMRFGARLVVVREEDRQVVAEALVGIGGAAAARAPRRAVLVAWSCRPLEIAPRCRPFAGGKPSSIIARSISAAVSPSLETERGGGAAGRRQGLRAVEAGASSHGAADAALASASPAASMLTMSSAAARAGIVAGGRLGEHVRGRLGDEFGRLALVEHGEARRHVRLERHKVQEALAEGVDGLDLEAAGRLDGAGEEPPRQLHLAALGALAFELRQLRDRAPARRASPSVRAARRRESPCWRRPPW